jgi:hypothetical protein
MGMLLVPLESRGRFVAWAKVDPGDAPYVVGRKWFFDGMYAATKSGKHNLRLHRHLFGRKLGNHGVEVDHINQDKLDNRRENLRLVPHSVNMRNVPAQAGSSQFRGVTWNKQRGHWIAQASHAGRTRYLGSFDDEQEAAGAVVAFWQRIEESA